MLRSTPGMQRQWLPVDEENLVRKFGLDTKEGTYLSIPRAGMSRKSQIWSRSRNEAPSNVSAAIQPISPVFPGCLILPQAEWWLKIRM